MRSELIVNTNPKSSLSEAIKTIRTNLQFSSIDQPLKSLAITSSTPREGKSFISSNLAVAFAQDGNKVLIVDCDLRKGRQHEIFNVDNSKGLSNLLIDNIKQKYKRYILSTDIPNLSILPMGTIPPNPTELLNSEKNKELNEILEASYDIVIYDCVPVTGLTDALIMSTIADKTVIVCLLKETPMKLLINSKKAILGVNGNLAGVVVNNVQVKRNNYYSNSGYYTND